MFYANESDIPVRFRRLTRIVGMLSKVDGVRHELVDEIKSQIARGEYLTEDKLNEAIAKYQDRISELQADVSNRRTQDLISIGGSVLGSILFGLATPTEAAAVGALGSMVLAAAYRALTWPRLQEAVYLTARTSAMVCFLFVGSWTFSSVFSYLGGEGLVKEFVLGLNLNPILFLIIAQCIIFLLGWPLEWSEIIIIFVPIFLPLLPHFHVDPMMFGILVALNLQTSFLTPPMAMSAYYLKGIAPPYVQLWTIFKGCFPFLGMVFVTMIMVYVFPQMMFWLPNLIYGR